jgi:hypothetical protein
MYSGASPTTASPPTTVSLGENYVAAVGYLVGAADTFITVVFPTARTAAGYTLHWKNAPGNATHLPITVRDAQA